MTRIRVSVLDSDALRQGDAPLIEGWQREGAARLWVDIEDPTEALLEELLEQRFGFHELAAEDSLSPNTLPKYDAFPHYDFFVFRAVDLDLREHGTHTTKLAAFLGRNFLFTVHTGVLPAIDEIYGRLSEDKRIIKNGADYLLYEIVDLMVDAHFPLLEKIEECVDDLQDEIFRNAHPSHLDELLHLKRDVNVMRRQSLPQRELLNLMSRGDSPFIQKQHLIYFRDLYDHMFRISETIDSERDMMAGTMEAYLSVIANRTNEIMRVLTVLSTIMLPLTLIAGIYGMNFEHMPELHWLHGYPFALGLMAAIALVMLLFFWKKGWIGTKRDKETEK
ncbi:MAG TPA: magnesium/cobalt transporter CorA [Thermoanaerobaculia bacterium]|nr:magnesium/cobalt transporter CorA [Thermoanaerobaculia bacterium]